MRIVSVLAGAATVVVIGAGLTGATPAAPDAPALRGHALPIATAGAPGAAAFGAADTRFGLALLRQLAAGDSNVVFSPSSVASALGMVSLGARGATADAMARCLALPATGTPLLAGLRGRTEGLRSTPHLRTADTVWVDPSVSTSPDYLDRVATAYDAGVRQVPLLSNAGDAAQAINGAVANQTDGRIPRIVSPDQLDGIGWVLTDAVYLKAKWADAFRAEDTQPGPFHRTGGTVTATYLHGTSMLGYAHEAGWTAVTLPYSDKRLEMVALLPDGAAAAPTPDILARLTAATARQQVTLALPKVSLAYSRELSQPLRAMGMGPAFDATADFTGMSPDAGPIRFVQHKATLDVAEKGTEAAAATAAGNVATSAVRPVEARTVTFDHPYLMLIRDTTTGEPLFLASVTDPTAH